MPSEDFTQRNTHSWRISLGNASDVNNDSTLWLRNEFFKLRDCAKFLLAEISRDLPDFTQHDISHCDALWEMADYIGGEELDLNPAEGFVLGAVFLLHDAALSLSALPGRLEELRRDPLWADTAIGGLKKSLGRQPSANEIAAVNDGKDREMDQWIAATVLRTRHAEYAQRLALQPYKDVDGELFYLIEDEALRSHFGRDIGRIAASHGMSLEAVSHDFAKEPLLPSIAGHGPPEWQVNRLKLACLIRTCDAIHLDSRRAPGFLRAIRRPPAGSDPHWQFQRRITLARQGDSMRFVSGYAFPASEALAWWTGYELIQNADRELRQVDALLSDLGEPRFAAHRATGAEAPERLQATIPTNGWEPIEARVRITNVSSVVRNLGGESLYGRDSRGTVPLRELIQNACDAVRARRVLEANDSYGTNNLGEIVVRQGRDGHGHWIEVEDNGLGMSGAVLTGPLLDFGSSLWNTPLQYIEWPGLSGRGFEATGRFGIGFFSVFMWGERVCVTSRRFDQARDATRVLEWQKGLDWHALLRTTTSDEYIKNGGTRVRVWTTLPSNTETDTDTTSHWDLASLCMELCPSLDVRLIVEYQEPETPDDSTPKAAVRVTTQQILEASDWMDCDGKELLRRTWSPYYNFDSLRSPELLETIAQMLRPLHRNGALVGRACLFDLRMGIGLFGSANARTGCVTVGGMRAAELTGIAGVLAGEPIRSARDEAIPVVDAEEIARWSTEQARLFAPVVSDFSQQIGAARIVRTCGGLTGPLFITATSGPEGWLMHSHQDIVEMAHFPDEIVFLDFAFLEGARWVEDLHLNFNVFLTTFDHAALLSPISYFRPMNWTLEMPQRYSHIVDSEWRTRYRTLFGALIEAVAAHWGCSVDDVLAASTLKSSANTPPYEREIGTVNGRPISQQVGLLRRP